MSSSQDGSKGHVVEESLRGYFLEAGYFVARGVPVEFASEEVSDVDLWLYIRSSAIHRSRANVDIKARQRAKAFERVVWAKGIQVILGLDDAIVATTDKREAVKRYALAHAVRVLDGSFLQRLETRTPTGRLSEEEFQRQIDPDNLDKLRGNWRDRLHDAKARLLTSLDFGGCNFWLLEAAFFLSRFAIQEREQAALRAMYLNLAYFNIGLDFRYRDFAFEQEDDRRKILVRGFQQGENDWTELRSVIRRAAPELSRELEFLNKNGREQVLAQYFADTKVSTRLFDIARRLENAAFAPQVPSPEELDADLKGIIGVFADYAGIDRRRVLRSISR
jgi:hypothetical protein